MEQPQLTQDQILNWVVIIITVGALAIGLISMAIGWLARLWDWLIDYRPAPITSSRAIVPASRENEREQRSDAMEHAGNSAREHVPDLAETIGNMPDDLLLDILAQVRDGSGDYRFAESRIGRFIGGRLEDRIAQVREARGEETPARPGEYRTPHAGRPTSAKFAHEEADQPA